ncbi:monosaccharide ABC transporter substrate-binding protein, CUT2 family [Allokutzneria albata]|uniref:Monosaccharide ABC transporter substrate-binding protein, CUT2 family n=1 Tax=Allokutzneria albata TaxID=211114 RepID=A0A1G9QY16_ALLAB|nr:monosaccharide ABC transporter substrate-binding protein, CUT2 family [Allokutzneria albata]
MNRPRKGTFDVRRTITATACLMLAVTACGTTSQNSGKGGPATQAKCEGPGGKYVIGMSQANVAEPYRQRMDDDIRAAAAKVPQFEVKFADAAQDNAKQVSDVENFLTQQVNLLIISPNEATPLTAVVKKAYDKGIPVLVLDRKVDGDSYTSFIGADNRDIGRQAGKYVAEKLLPGGGKLVELKGLPGSTPAQERSEGFHETLGTKVQVVATGVGDWLREKGQQQLDAILKANPEVDVVYAHNDPMAEGAYLAAKAAGRESKIKFIGIDALPIPSGGVKAVEQGRISATFTYPTGGKEAIAAAKTLLVDCKQVEKKQTLPTQLITKENAERVYREANG